MYVIYRLMIIHVISRVDAVMLPVPRLYPYWQIMLFSNSVCKRPPYQVSKELSWVQRYDVVCTWFTGRCGSGGYKQLDGRLGSHCSGGFGGYPCWEACSSGSIRETGIIQINIDNFYYIIEIIIYSCFFFFFFFLFCFLLSLFLSFFLSNYFLSFGTLSLIIHLLVHFDVSVYAPMWAENL